MLASLHHIIELDQRDTHGISSPKKWVGSSDNDMIGFHDWKLRCCVANHALVLPGPYPEESSLRLRSHAEVHPLSCVFFNIDQHIPAVF